MADVTWGVKVSDELKEKLQDIIKSDFGSSKDFIESLVNLHELNKVKQDSNIFSDEVDELENLTRRVNNIFINANAKVKSMVADKDIKFSELMQGKTSLIDTLQQTINQLKNENGELVAFNDELVNLRNEHSDRVNELTESNNNVKALNEEFKAKNDMLTGLLTKYEKYPEQIEAVKALLADAQSKNAELTDELKENVISIKGLTNRIEASDREHASVLDKLKADYQRDLQAARELEELEKGKAILKLKEDQQKEMELSNAKHNTAIAEYQEKYKTLLLELEQSRKAKAAKTATAKPL